jgi:hypothetical protein
MSRISCLSLHQPWASLIAIGAKRVETRSWGTLYRGPLAIHAAKTTANIQHFRHEPFKEILAGDGLSYPEDLPLGGVVAIAELVDCLPTEARICLPGVFDDYPDLDTPKERAFGDFTPGRYGWVLENVRRVDPMIPLVGRQGLWTIDASILPEGILSKSENK